MKLSSVWKQPFGAGQLSLVAGWTLWWLFNPNVGSPAEKDLLPPVLLTLAVLVPFALVLGLLAGLGATGRPKLERISYIVFAAIASLVGNAFIYAPDDLFYCDVSGHPSCATSVTERFLGLLVMESAILIQLGMAFVIVSLIRRPSATKQQAGEESSSTSN